LRHAYEKPNRDHEVTKDTKDHEEELVFFVGRFKQNGRCISKVFCGICYDDHFITHPFM